MAKKKPDLVVSGGGSVYLFTPNTRVGRKWVKDYLPSNALTFGGGVAVEWRFVGDIVVGARGDGLTVTL